MPYIPPQDVAAPQERWTLHRALVDDGPDTPASALGTWDGARCIGARWNGNDDNPTGWPRIYVHPCWHILDEKLWDSWLPGIIEQLAGLGIRASLPPHDHPLGYEWALDSEREAVAVRSASDLGVVLPAAVAEWYRVPE